MDLKSILLHRPDVAWKEVDGSIILMDLGALKRVHRLNPVGSFIWQNLDGVNNLEVICGKLCETFDVEASLAEKDLLELVDQLLLTGVVSVAEGDKRGP